MTVVTETTVLKCQLCPSLDRGVAAGAALARDCCQGCPKLSQHRRPVQHCVDRVDWEVGRDGQYYSREWLDSR